MRKLLAAAAVVAMLSPFGASAAPPHCDAEDAPGNSASSTACTGIPPGIAKKLPPPPEPCEGGVLIDLGPLGHVCLLGTPP